MYNSEEGKYYKHILDWETREVEKVECIDHQYTWSGKTPCTGIYMCIHCGKIGNDQTRR